MQRRGQRIIQPFDAKRAITRFGVVQMPRTMDPNVITVEDLLTNRRLRLVPDAELTDGVRKLLADIGVEPLPNLRPKPEISQAQALVMQIVAELTQQGICCWETLVEHYAAFQDLTLAKAFQQVQRVANALSCRLLLAWDGPMLTLAGYQRLAAEETVEYWRWRLGLVEYPIDRIEPRPDRNYDEVYFIRDNYLECFYRHECFEVRNKVVVLSSLQLVGDALT